MKTFEFKVVELSVPPDVLAQAADPEVRAGINPIIEEVLNENGVDGWQLHSSGLTSMPTLIFVREVIRRKKGAKNG